MNKRNVLWAGLISTGFFFLAMYPAIFGICEMNNYDCRKTSDLIQIIFGIFPVVFFLSLITYKMRDEVFEAWWKPARFFIPIIMLVTLLVNSKTRSGGMGISGAIAGGFDIFLIGIFYFIFIVISLVRIVSVYRK
ncbi:MAG: hypothetical protein PHH40_01190 [Candidatus Moranbacteria bacterium]|nr:hypothetical protein [Candidatus Moranbacteria bacterium]MDD3964927.1 hypothetical protein [Candidatus Moranbacteria bacterium]